MGVGREEISNYSGIQEIQYPINRTLKVKEKKKEGNYLKKKRKKISLK